MEFPRIQRLPPYVFNVIGDLKVAARARGEDIIDLGMGNSDHPTPPHIVAKLIEAAQKPANYRYSASRGFYKLRVAICDWYRRRFDVELDPDSEAIVTIGSKEGIAIREVYRSRRDVLCDGLARAGWSIPKPRATMFVWAEIPDEFKSMGSIEFSKLLLREAKVAVSPGIGFGEYGDEFVRMALIENEHRTRQAVRGIRNALGGGGTASSTASSEQAAKPRQSRGERMLSRLPGARAS